MGSSFLLRKSTRSIIMIRPSTPYPCHNPIIKRYTPSSNTEERAPSLADEFKRVAEEKAKAEETAHVADQGVASQTSDKTFDGAKEVSIGHGDTDAVRERSKEHESKE